MLFFTQKCDVKVKFWEIDRMLQTSLHELFFVDSLTFNRLICIPSISYFALKSILWLNKCFLKKKCWWEIHSITKMVNRILLFFTNIGQILQFSRFCLLLSVKLREWYQRAWKICELLRWLQPMHNKRRCDQMCP